ncbi:MAG: hypothetical protein J0M26_26800 [Planctomycetes bacterium]|nr:hypothetical protein [Planctomycetota bacterium]
MSKPVSVDFQFSIKRRGRGAKKRIVEVAAQADESKPALERIPRIARYMALAIHFEDLIREGVVTDYADLARLGHVTRARVTQIMNLRLLSPEIQEELLQFEGAKQHFRMPQLKELQRLASDYDWRTQRYEWRRRNTVSE